MGLCNYVSRFVESFSENTEVLREQQKYKIVWSQKYQTAFENLKAELANRDILAFYDPTKEIEIVTDASNHAIGGILFPKENDQTRPVCYVSHSLTPLLTPAEVIIVQP